MHLSRLSRVDPEQVDRRISLPRPPLIVNNQTITEFQTYKYLGVIINTQLRWKEQAQRAMANATKWLLQYRRLTRPSSGTSTKLMRQLYVSVALPKITYGLDVWYTPPTQETRPNEELQISRSLTSAAKNSKNRHTSYYRYPKIYPQ